MKFAFIFIIASFLFFFSEKSHAKTLNLKAAIDLALERSLALDSAKKAVSLRNLEYKNARYKLLPSVDFSTTDGLQNNISISPQTNTSTTTISNPTAPWYSSVNLGITESLYDNGVSWTNSKIAYLNENISSLNLLKARDTLILNMKSEFYRYSLASILLETRKQQQALLDKQFKTLTGQYRQGFKTRIDFLRFKSQVQRSEIEKIKAENTVFASNLKIGKLIGLSPSILQSEDLSFEALSVNQSENILPPTQPPILENIYDYKIYKLQEEINEKQYTLTNRNRWPQIFLSSGISYSNQNYINSKMPYSAGNQLNWNALVTLQYNIWDWGQRKQDATIAAYNQDIQNNTLRQNITDIQSKISILMSDIQQVAQNYKLSIQIMSLEKESADDLENKYREAKVTYLDLITGLNSYLDAKIQYYTSYFDVLENRAQHEFLEGKIYEKTLEE